MELTKTFKNKQQFSKFIPDRPEKSFTDLFETYFTPAFSRVLHATKKHREVFSVYKDVLALRSVEKTLSEIWPEPAITNIPDCSLLVHFYRYKFFLSVSRYLFHTKIMGRTYANKSHSSGNVKMKPGSDRTPPRKKSRE